MGDATDPSTAGVDIRDVEPETYPQDLVANGTRWLRRQPGTAGRFRGIRSRAGPTGTAAPLSPTSLDATSEFGAVHECFTDPGRDVSDLFGDAPGDADISTRFVVTCSPS